MERPLWVVVVLSVAAAALAGCGGGSKAPLSGGSSSGGASTGSVQGRLALPGTRQALANRFVARVHGTDDEQALVVRVNTDGTFRIDGVPGGQQTVTVEDAQGAQGAVVVVFVRPGQINDVGEIVPQPLGKIAGIVSEVDANGMPVRPIARARVLAHPLATGQQDDLQDLSERPVFTARTNASGSYELLLPPGDYLVEVQHPDYEPAAQTVSVQRMSTTALDFGLHPRPRQTGTVVGTVSAQVNGQQVPVPGALVVLLPRGARPQPLNVGSVISALQHDKGDSRQHPLFTFTKADGSFMLTGVPAGDYTAFAFKKGLGQDQADITVQADASVTVHFVLQARLGVIRGKVTDAMTGQPIGGATVIAIRAGDPFWDWDDWRESDDRKGGKGKWHRPSRPKPNDTQASPNFPPLPPSEPPVRVGTLTDADGNYQLVVPPGTYFVAAGADGYEWQAQEVTVTVGATATADFALVRTQLASVQVQLEVEQQVVAGESVTMRLKVENEGAQPVTLTFPTSQRYDFIVTRTDGTVVWQWSHGKNFTQAVGTLTLAPGQEVELQEEWDQRGNDGNLVAPGDYQVRGVLTVKPPIVTAPEPLTIAPAASQ